MEYIILSGIVVCLALLFLIGATILVAVIVGYPLLSSEHYDDGDDDDDISINNEERV